MLITIYIILIVSIIGTFILSWKIKSATAIGSFVAMVTLFVVVFLTTHPVQNKIETPGFSIESQLRQVEHKQKELTKIVSILMKISYIARDMDGRWGPLPQHSKIIDEYIEELNEYLPPDFREDIEKELQELLKEETEK